MSSNAAEEIVIPRETLLSAAALVLLAALAALIAKSTDYGATRLSLGEPVQVMTLRFDDLPDGVIGVVDATSGKTVETYAPGKDGFVRVVMRSFAYEREQYGYGPDKPFRLMRLNDGRDVIEDTATGKVVMLRAFGWGNAEAFAKLIDKGRTQQ